MEIKQINREITELNHQNLMKFKKSDGFYCLCEAKYISEKRGGGNNPTTKLVRRFKYGRGDEKERAIAEVAEMFRKGLDERVKEDGWGKLTFVPIPPSKVRGNKGYDDRIMEMIEKIRPGRIDARALVYQTENRKPAHWCGAGNRPDCEEIYNMYRIDDGQILPEPKRIVITDDLLVTGTQYHAMRRRLSERFPSASFFGLFIARNGC